MGLKLAGLMFVMMLGMAGIGYWYYNDSQARMAILQENNAKLNTAIQISEQAISSLQENILKANQQLKQVNEEFAAIRAQNAVLADKLAKHDLAVLGAGKPGLVERLVNRGTENVNRCFELLSGAPLTDKEKEAKDGRSFNNECPWLWPGRSTP